MYVLAAAAGELSVHAHPKWLRSAVSRTGLTFGITIPSKAAQVDGIGTNVGENWSMSA